VGCSYDPSDSGAMLYHLSYRAIQQQSHIFLTFFFFSSDWIVGFSVAAVIGLSHCDNCGSSVLTKKVSKDE